MLQSARNMTTQEIEKYLGALNDELNRMGVKGEICLYGGAVMCLVYQARPSTKDVDEVFQSTAQMREAAERVAQAYGLRLDWLNDAVKGFVVEHPQRALFNFPALKVYAPEPDYLLAMKTLASRVESTDKQDVLMKNYGYTQASQAEDQRRPNELVSSSYGFR
jgi:hypothetical protein